MSEEKNWPDSKLQRSDGQVAPSLTSPKPAITQRPHALEECSRHTRAVVDQLHSPPSDTLIHSHLLPTSGPVGVVVQLDETDQSSVRNGTKTIGIFENGR